jgi:predicted AlkP superfamily pyrophosphatase or phosphodiesterase
MRNSVVGLLFLSMLAASAAAPQPVAGPDVRLILLVTVDQFRYDYLTRFRADYSQGFRRLLEGGAVFTDASLEHYPTVTAVGHATSLSGATPSVSGIIGNDWFDRATGVNVTSVSDPTVTPVGSTTAAMSASPRRLLVSTLGDEMKMSAGAPKGAADSPRVIGMSLKDRSAILPGGRGADASYWWDPRTGNFVTSTYYMTELPGWVRAFNERRPADSLAGKAWTLLAQPSTSLKVMPVKPGVELNDAVWASPYGNDLLLSLAEAALEHERLGQRGVTDLFSVSFSSNDSVGHTYGPDSPQVRDIAVRTDRVIGRLLDRVDALIGLRHTIVAFTTDHGVAPVPEVAQQRSLPAGRLTSKELFGPIETALAERYGPGKWILGTAGSSPYLNHRLMAQMKIEQAEARAVAAQAAMAVPHVARVYTREQLLLGVPGDRIGSRVLRGFNPQRSGDLEILLEPYWMRQATGTTHGTPYNYDAHIPLILMGQRIRPGAYADHAALNDLAPTLATLLAVPIPSGSSGRVLTEALLPSTELSAGQRETGSQPSHGR